MDRICNIPTFPLVARRFSQPVFGSSGGAGNGIKRKRTFNIKIYNIYSENLNLKKYK